MCLCIMGNIRYSQARWSRAPSVLVTCPMPWLSLKGRFLVGSVAHLLPAQEQDDESARMERGDDIELEKKKHHKLLGIRRKLIRALLMPLLCLLFAAAAVTVYYMKYTLVRLAGLQRGRHEVALNAAWERHSLAHNWQPL